MRARRVAAELVVTRVVATVVTIVVAGCANPPVASTTVRIELIAFNDFHGNLEAPDATIRAPADGLAPDVASRDVDVPAGGAARFATMIRTLAAKHPNHAIVASGDLIGATPLVSALFLDEPTIEAMNLIGLEYSAVGNHEFDRGVAELKRKQTGGCERHVASLEPCRGGHRFEGARFQYLAANVIDRETRQPIFPAYGIKSFDGVRVGFIGLTLKGTDQLVDPGGIRSVEFVDEATTINARAAELRAGGVHTIVVLIHEGGFSKARLNETSCPGLTGDILPILDRLDAGVDVVASAHTHQPYVCNYRGILLTSAASYGRLVTDIDLEVDRGTGKVVGKSALNRVVASEGYGGYTTQSGYPLLDGDAAVASVVGDYARRVAPLAERKVGIAAGPLDNRADATGQSPLGAVLADAELEATKSVGARIALVNSGSVRAPIAPPADGAVTYGALFRSQPFGDHLVTMTLSGAQIQAALEQQWLVDRERSQMLQVSAGFRYAYDLSRPIGARIVSGSLALNGARIVPENDYRVTVNSFTAGGGDGFSVLTQGRDKAIGSLDIDAAEAYFMSHSPVAAPTSARVAKQP